MAQTPRQTTQEQQSASTSPLPDTLSAALLSLGVISHEYKDPFQFYTSEVVDTTKWSSVYPYRLSYYTVNDDGSYQRIDSPAIVLPITPSELQIRMPFASQVTATLRGVLEENAGVPFREITFSGTTGILPGSARGTSPTFRQPNFLQTIFGGTITAANTFARSASSLIPSSSTPVRSNPTPINASGYSLFLALHNFLERYALEKRGTYAKGDSTGQITRPGQSHRLRLVLEMYKENWFWVLTPREFTLRRMASDPHLYFYHFTATAWKRKSANSLNVTTVPYPPNGPIAQRPNGFQQALNTMRQAVTTIAAARDVISAVRGDLTGRLLDPLRYTTLFLKESVALGTDLMDMPQNIRKDIQQTVVRSWDTLKASFPTSSSFTKSMSQASTDVANQTASQSRAPSNSANPINKIFADPIPDPEIFGEIPISILDVPQEIVARIESEREFARDLRKKDFELYRDSLISVSEELATGMGLGSETYSFLVGSDSGNEISTIQQPSNPPAVTDEQFDVLFELQNALQVLDALVASGTVDDNRVVDSLNYVAAVANRANIPFTIPTSKYLVPVPYGATLEAISMLYLQDPNRWSEIATLNGLLPPYIDEVGFALELQTNGSGNQFTLDSSENLYVGQTVKLSSNTVSVFKRHILSIDPITASSILITVDGDSDLDSLKVVDGATMRAFLPGTANSEQLIYVPGNGSAPDDPKFNTIPGIDDTDALIKLSGIDLLLTTDGDIILTEDGDTRLAYGLAGLVQSLKLMMAVPKGSLLQHPGFGFGISAGTSVADLTASTIMRAIQDTVAQDNRFTGVDALEMLIKPPVLQLNVATSLRGLSALLPISVQIPLPS